MHCEQINKLEKCVKQIERILRIEYPFARTDCGGNFENECEEMQCKHVYACKHDKQMSEEVKALGNMLK